MRPRRNEANGRYAIVHQLACKFATRHVLIANGEVETVGNGAIQVAVIDDMEPVAQEDVLQFAGTLAIDLHFVAEAVFAIAGSTEHLCQRILCRMARAAAQGIEHAGREHKAEGQTLVACAEVGEVTTEELVADAHHADTLTCIRESLRAADEQHVVVCIASYCWLIGRFERNAQVLAEVHREVGKVFHDDAVVLCCQLADSPQLALRKTNPRGVVGVGIDDGTDVAFCHVALELSTQLVATIVIDIEGFVLHALHLQLHLLHGKAWVDEQHRVLLPASLRTSEEGGKSALHGATYGHTALGSYIHADESLYEARGLPLQFGVSLNVRVGMGNAVLKCLYLRLDSYLSSRKSGNAHFHLDELYSTLLLGHCCHLLHLANGGLGKVLNAHLRNQSIDNRPGNRGRTLFLFHN